MNNNDVKMKEYLNINKIINRTEYLNGFNMLYEDETTFEG